VGFISLDSRCGKIGSTEKVETQVERCCWFVRTIFPRVPTKRSYKHSYSIAVLILFVISSASSIYGSSVTVAMESADVSVTPDSGNRVLPNDVTNPVSKSPRATTGQSRSVPISDTLRNSWYYYFSTLAQTIAGVSALLIALAIICLQTHTNALGEVQKLISKICFDTACQGRYLSEAFPHYESGDWVTYFSKVESIANDDANKRSFADESTYEQSLPYMNSLITLGRASHVKRREVRRALLFAFFGTVVYAVLAVLLLPVAPWVSMCGFQLSWGISGFAFVVLFVFYGRLAYISVKNT
jgi:hypothetical protein